MSWQYWTKIVPCVLLLLSGLLISGDPTAKRRIVSFLATFGMANDDDEASIENSAGIVVKVMYGVSFLLFVWSVALFWQQHRKLVVRSLDIKPIPYQSKPASKGNERSEQTQPAAPSTPADTTPPSPGQKKVRPLTTTLRPLPYHYGFAYLHRTQVGERLQPT